MKTMDFLKVNCNLKLLSLILLMTLPFDQEGFSQEVLFTMPEESALHEGTWIQWPHNYLYGPTYKWEVSSTFVQMTAALEWGENVHIVAYDSTEMNQIINRLNNNDVPLDNIDFYIFETDDVWVRDNGPIYVYDQNDELNILDWGFNGWGNDTPFEKCDLIPTSIATETDMPVVDLNLMVLEGGAIEHDGFGTMMATRSSITHPSRNPDLSEEEIEQYLTTYLGLTNFIWLDGVYGSDITDMHIDGFVKFAGNNIIVTMDSLELDYWFVSPSEIETIYNATNAEGEPFEIVTLPLTQGPVITSYGLNLVDRGSYVNYYIGNEVVLVPTYNDPNDSVAISILENVHPNRQVIGIDSRNMYAYGGMVHCLTQQQPVANVLTSNKSERALGTKLITKPNPVQDRFSLEHAKFANRKLSIQIIDQQGVVIQEFQEKAINGVISIDSYNMKLGAYNVIIRDSAGEVYTSRFVKSG